MKSLIPPKTKTRIVIFNKGNITFRDMGFLTIILVICLSLFATTMNFYLKGFLVVLIVIIGFLGVLKPKGEPNYIYVLKLLFFFIREKNIEPFNYNELSGIEFNDDHIKTDKLVLGIYEIEGIDFDILEESQQDYRINSLKYIFENIKNGKIIKLDKSIDYSPYIECNKERIKKLEKEGKYRHISILNKQNETLDTLQNYGNDTVSAYYLVVYGNNIEELNFNMDTILTSLEQATLVSKRLDRENLRRFIENFYGTYLTEDDIFIHPKVIEKPNKLVINGEDYMIASIGSMPMIATNAWLSELYSIPGVKISTSFRESLNREKIIKQVDNTIVELNSRYIAKGIPESTKVDIDFTISAFNTLLEELKLTSDTLLQFTFYILYPVSKKKEVEDTFKEKKMFIDNLYFRQLEAYSEMMPFNFYFGVVQECINDIQATSFAASFPFLSKTFLDPEGQYIAYNQTPIFMDLYASWKKQDPNRKNANLVVIGESGGGKTYYVKAVNLAHALDNKRVFALDPENEFSHMAKVLGGIVIDVGGLGRGTINPLHVFPTLRDDDEDTDSDESMYGHLSNQVQFLQEFFKTVIPEMTQMSSSYLNTAIMNLYNRFNITDLNVNDTKTEDFPLIQDLYEEIEILEKQSIKENSLPIIQESILRLKIAFNDFIGEGVYSRLWNKHTTLVVDNDFTVFNFQTLFASSNTILVSGQMLLIMRFLMQEVIKNKNNNDLYGLDKNISITVEEAHLFIDPDNPVALNFMAQMSRRIRKYGGGLITSTQNIDDFVGHSERTKVQASAIINSSAYSTIFGLKQSGINSVRDLYAKGGNSLSELELGFLANARQGEALFVVASSKRFLGKVNLFEGEETIIENIKGYEFVNELYKPYEIENYLSKTKIENDDLRTEEITEEVEPTPEELFKDKILYVKDIIEKKPLDKMRVKELRLLAELLIVHDFKNQKRRDLINNIEGKINYFNLVNQ